MYIYIYIYIKTESIQALPATLLVKFQNRMQSKISNDACSYENEKSFVGLIRNDRLVLFSFGSNGSLNKVLVTPRYFSF